MTDRAGLSEHLAGAVPRLEVHLLGCVSFSSAGVQWRRRPDLNVLPPTSLSVLASVPESIDRSVAGGEVLDARPGVEPPPMPESASAIPFTDLLAQLTPFIRALARRLAPRELDLQEDLKQEGRIALWRLDPMRLAAVRRADGYRRGAIRFAMHRHLRDLRRQVPGGRGISWSVVEEVLDAYREKAA